MLCPIFFTAESMTFHHTRPSMEHKCSQDALNWRAFGQTDQHKPRERNPPNDFPMRSPLATVNVYFFQTSGSLTFL